MAIQYLDISGRPGLSIHGVAYAWHEGEWRPIALPEGAGVIDLADWLVCFDPVPDLGILNAVLDAEAAAEGAS